jgi:nitroreductase
LISYIANFQRRGRMTEHAMPDTAVPNDLIRKILEAGVCAPSGGNMQRWWFVVIRDTKTKETVGAYYKRAWDEQVAPRYRAGDPASGMSRERFLRLLDTAEYLAAHIHEALVCGHDHDREIGEPLLDLGQQLQAVHPRHVNVREDRDQRGTDFPREPIQRLLARSGEIHHIGSLASLAAKVLAKEVSDIGFVIHHQDACATRRLPEGHAHTHDAASANVVP